LREARGTLFLRWGEKDGRFWRADGLDLAPSEADGLEDIVHLLRVNRRMELFYFGEDRIKLLFVRRMREASIEARSIAMVDGEADGAAVVEGVKHTAVSKVIGETTLLEHLAGEGGEDKMEGFVEEHCLGDEAIRR
jgi:hypothetical protein